MTTEQYVVPELNNTKEMLLYAINKIIEQGEQSITKNPDDKPECMYRSDELKCAVGWLINDEYYKSEMEYSSVTEENVYTMMDKSLNFDMNDTTDNLGYLTSLQDAHDSFVTGHNNKGTFMETFKYKIETFVKKNKLPEYCLEPFNSK